MQMQCQHASMVPHAWHVPASMQLLTPLHTIKRQRSSLVVRLFNPLHLLPLPKAGGCSKQEPVRDLQMNHQVPPGSSNTDISGTAAEHTSSDLDLAAYPARAATHSTWPAINHRSYHSSSTAHLKFAKHLAVVSNGCAPQINRFESLGWLLFECKRLQAAAVGPDSTTAAAWLCSAGGVHLLEQIYLVGMALADLGTADGVHMVSSSNGSRAIASLDYSRLLERFLRQHGHLLAEEFWMELQDHDELQARAIHIATTLETRCQVHNLLFDRLLDRVGTESHVGVLSQNSGHSGPLATAITNNLITTTQQHSAPVTTQSTFSAPTAANNSSSTSSSSNNNASKASSVWGWAGPLGAVVVLLCTIAGKVVQVLIAVVSFSKDVLLHLLMMRAVTATTKAVATKAAAGSNQLHLQPAAAVTALPADIDRTTPFVQPAPAIEQPALAAAAAAALQPTTASTAQQQMRLNPVLHDKQPARVAADVQGGPVKRGVHAVRGLVGRAATIVRNAHSTQQQRQQSGRRTGSKGVSGSLLYHLWSPSDAGLQDMAAAAGRGVLCDDAGWGRAQHLTALTGSTEGDW